MDLSNLLLPHRLWISPLLCYLKGCGSLTQLVTSSTADLSPELLPRNRWISISLCYLSNFGSLSAHVTSPDMDLSLYLLPRFHWISPIFCYLVASGSLPHLVTSGVMDLSVVKSCRGLVGERTWCVPHARSPTVGVAAVYRWRYDTPHPSSGTRTS